MSNDQRPWTGRLSLGAAIAVTVFAAWAAQAHAYVYWTDYGKKTIGRANLDGTGVDPGFITGAGGSYGLAVDDRHLYWTVYIPETIGRANLDGSGADPSFITGALVPIGLAIDGDHVYWTDGYAWTIGRARLDGSVITPSFIGGGQDSKSVAVDDRYVYWVSYSGNSIKRANLDGSGAHTFVSGADGPVGVAVDDQHVYWVNSGSDTLGRANLDGSGADQRFITGARNVWGAVAVDDRHVYWTSYFEGTIGRANLDGSGADHSFITGAGAPSGLAVDGGPAGNASPSTGELSFGSQPVGTLGAPTALTITNSGHGNLAVDTARLTGAGGDDFRISHDSCSQTTLALGATCTVRVRFGPSATGSRQAALTISSNDPASPVAVPLRGTGVEPVNGPAGPGGAAGAPGATAPTGPAGSQGPAGPQDRPSHVRLVTCKSAKKRGRTKRRCTTRLITGTARFTIPGRARATLTRRGRLYATGTASRRRLLLHSRRRVRRGRYTLTLRYRRTTTRIPITVR